MALNSMCFHILYDEIVHRLNHHVDRQEAVKSSTSIDELANDPFSMTSWQFPTGNVYHRSMAHEDFCGLETTGSVFSHENEINILKDSYNQVDVTRDCKPILKLEDHLVPMSAVYTLPEVDEEAEVNTNM